MLYGIYQGKLLTALSGFLSSLIHQTTASFQALNVTVMKRWEGIEPFTGLSINHKFKQQLAPSNLWWSHSLMGRILDREIHNITSHLIFGLLCVLMEIVP